jgi:hypothetical protein
MSDEAFGTSRQYFLALRDLEREGVPSKQVEILRAHFSAPAYTATRRARFRPCSPWRTLHELSPCAARKYRGTLINMVQGIRVPARSRGQAAARRVWACLPLVVGVCPRGVGNIVRCNFSWERMRTYLKEQLTGYDGPPAQREPSWVEVLERASLSLATYVEPAFG